MVEYKRQLLRAGYEDPLPEIILINTFIIWRITETKASGRLIILHS